MLKPGRREVSYQEFYAVIGPQDAHPEVTGSYPYTCVFKTRYRAVVGWAVGQVDGTSLYYLPEKEEPCSP